MELTVPLLLVMFILLKMATSLKYRLLELKIVDSIIVRILMCHVMIYILGPIILLEPVPLFYYYYYLFQLCEFKNVYL